MQGYLKAFPENPLPWGPGFLGAIRFDFGTAVEKEDVDSVVPPCAGWSGAGVCIRNLRGTAGANEIGEIFRKYNFLWYLLEEHSLNLRTLFFAESFSTIHAGHTVSEPDFPLEEITISLVFSDLPENQISALGQYGIRAVQAHPGIYRIGGPCIRFPTQMVVISELVGHVALRMLSRCLTQEELVSFFRMLPDKMDEETSRTVMGMKSCAIFLGNRVDLEAARRQIRV